MILYKSHYFSWNKLWEVLWSDTSMEYFYSTPVACCLYRGVVRPCIVKFHSWEGEIGWCSPYWTCSNQLSQISFFFFLYETFLWLFILSIVTDTSSETSNCIRPLQPIQSQSCSLHPSGHSLNRYGSFYMYGGTSHCKCGTGFFLYCPRLTIN